MAEVEIPIGYGKARYLYVNNETGQTASFGHGYRAPSGTVNDAALNFSDLASDTLSIGDAESMVSWWTFLGVECRQRVAGGIVGALEPADRPGSRVGGGAAPQNVAALVSVQTAYLGKQFRGRIFLPPAFFTGAELSNTTLTPTGHTNVAGVQTTWTNLVLAAGQPFPLYLLHAAPKVGDTPVPTLITGMNLEISLATQRRRLRR